MFGLSKVVHAEAHAALVPCKVSSTLDVLCFVHRIQRLVRKILRFLLASLYCVSLLVFGLFTAAQAETASNKAIALSAKLETGRDKGSEFQLEVRQMPLAQVLKELTAKTSIPIHYSVLPEGFITATCVGESLKSVLECLLNRKADVIVRYSQAHAEAEKKSHVAEAWVLGSKLEAVPNNALCLKTTVQGSMSLNQAEQSAENETKSKPDQTDYLLKIAQSGRPKDRADAIGALLSIGRQNDPKVKAMLEDAAHDQDADVRAQAVSTLTHRDDYRENAAGIIQEALQDSSVDVRIMAVDGITDDVGLLQQAVNDSDETVSAVATMKLEDLMKQQAKGQVTGSQ